MNNLAFDISANDRTGQIFDQIKAKGQSSFRDLEASVTRLQLRYDEGHRKAMEFAQGLHEIDRALAQNKIGMADAERLIVSMNGKLGLTGDATQLAAKGHTQLAAAVKNANTQIAAQATALNQQRRAANQNTSGGLNTANIAAQFQDIGVTAAMGMSPLQIALQQGTQLQAVLGGQGAAGAVRALGTAFLSLVNPVSLVTLAVVGLSAAAIQYFMSSEEESKAAEEALKRHEANIQAIKGAWGDAAAGVEAYAKQDKSVLRAENIVVGAGLREQLDAFTKSLVEGGLLLRPETERIKADIDRVATALNAETIPGTPRAQKLYLELQALYDQLEAGNSIALTATETFAPLRGAIDAFGASVRAGTPDFIALQKAVADGLNADPTNEELIRLSKTVGAMISQGVQLQSALDSSTSAFDRIGNAAKSAREQFEAFTDASNKLRQIASPQLDDRARALEAFRAGMSGASDLVERQKILRDYEATLARITAQEEGAKVPIPTQRPNDIERLDMQEPHDPWGDMRRPDQDALRVMTQQMKALKDAADAADRATMQNRSTFRGWLDDMDEAIMKGEKLGDVLKSGALGFVKTLKDRAFDSLADAFFPTSKTGGNVGPWGVFGQIFGFGGAAAGAASPVAQAVANDNFRPAANDNFSAPVIPVTRMPLGDVASWRSAIKSIESAGSGGYSALGPWTGGDRAYGAYQVMGNNVGPWSQAALGRRLTPEQFLADPMAQDAVFDHRFGGYVAKYGNPQDAASAWFTGRPLAQGAGAQDVLGTTGSVYVDKFNAQLTKATAGVDKFTTNSISTADGLGGFGRSLTGAASSLATAFDPKNLFGLGLSNTTGFMDGRGGGMGGLLGYATPASSGGGGLFGSLLGGLGSLASGFFSFIPKLFGFADGTDFAPGGLAIVGERGPELVNLARGSQVMTAERSERLMAGMNDNGPREVLLRVVGEEGPMFRPTIQAEAKGVAVRVVGDGISSYDKGMPGRVGDIMERNG